jgi:hypothetical protein
MYGNTLNDFNNASIGLGNTEFASKDKIVPDSIRFKTVKQAIAARRVPVKIRAEQQAYASNTNKLIRIILPNNCIYDTRKGYLTFDLTLVTTGGTYKRLHSGVFSAFNRLRILAGSTEIEDLRDYNRIYCILWEMMNPILVTGNVGVDTLGFGTQAQRNLLGTTTTQYACPVYSGVLNTELLPIDNIKSQLVLEFYLEDPTTCVETDGTNPIIQISNIVYHMERLELDQMFRSKIASYVNTHGLKLGFHTWERYISALTTGAQQNIVISQKSSSINGILNIFVNSGQISNPAINDKYITWPGPQNLAALTSAPTFVSTLINGTIYPDEPIDETYANAWEPYNMYLRWIQKWEESGIMPIAPPINSQVFPFDRFVQIDDFEPFPELDDVINPFTTLSNSSNIIKKLVFGGLITANYQLDSWIEFFKQICIYSDGSIQVIQ